MTDPQLLVYGQLVGKPQERTDTNGKPYTVAHVATRSSGRDLVVFAISYVPKVSFTLQALEPGDVVALSGALTVREDAVGVIARRILSSCATVREQPKRAEA